MFPGASRDPPEIVVRYTASIGDVMRIAVAVALIVCGSALLGLPLLSSYVHLTRLGSYPLFCAVAGLAMVMWGAFDVPSSSDADGGTAPSKAV